MQSPGEPPQMRHCYSTVIRRLLRMFSMVVGLAAMCMPAGEGQILQNSEQRPHSRMSWSKLNVIDIHAHIGHFKGFDLSDSALVDNVRRFGVKLAFVSNIDCAALPGVTADLNEEQANRHTVEFVSAHPESFRGLYWVRPRGGNLQLARQFLSLRMPGISDAPLFVGMKFHPDMNQFAADDPSVNAFLELCSQFKISAVFHCGSSSLSRANVIYSVARRHPSVPIVLYHMGFNTDHAEAISAVKQAVTKGDANLFLETSQCSGAAVLKAVSAVGSSRILFGTDATYYGQNHYDHYNSLITCLQKRLPARDFDNIVSRNALRIFPVRKNATGSKSK